MPVVLRCGVLSWEQDERTCHMYNIFKSLVSATRTPSDAERERAYLNAAVSRFDLERREREIENGLFRHVHPYF